MLKGIALILVLAVVGIGFISPLSARPVKGARYRHADRNNDGVVTRVEWRKEKKWEQQKRSKVNTSLEKKYDDNSDGWLSPSETKDMLSDRYRVIATDGKAKVNTALEAEYDTNNDGIIDVREAQEIKEDLGLD